MLADRPLLYLVTDRLSLEGKAKVSLLLDLLVQAAKAGVDLIQIREKDLHGRTLFELVKACVNVVRPFGAKVLVNDRIDVALAAEADGVHLASNSIPVAAARQLVGDRLLLGVSTHSLQQVKQAENAADFVVYGPVFQTLSKLKYGEPVGLNSLGEIVDATKLPVIAIGGITEANYDSVLHKGAAGIAAIGMFAKTDSLSKLIRKIKTG
jgi:thiamine-phosphate pyrophosphorylase